MRLILVVLFSIWSAVSLYSQELIAKLRQENHHLVKGSQITGEKFRRFLALAEVLSVNEVWPESDPKSILTGTVTLKLKNALSAAKTSQLLQQSGYFEYVEQLNRRSNTALHVPSDPFAQPGTGTQYYLEQVKAFDAWEISKGDTAVTICIVDNGLDFNHPEFKGKVQFNKNDEPDGTDNDNDGFVDNYQGWDFANDDNYPEDTNGEYGHGTQVSGIAAALTGNALGIASMGYNCRFVPYKIFGDAPVDSYTQYLAVALAAKLGCKVINMSWGSPGLEGDFYQYEQDLITYAAIEKDAVLVGATFPIEGPYFTFPGNYDYVLSVLSLFPDDRRLYPQSTHYWIDMSVPALDMFTTDVKGKYTTQTGISLGLPLVSGAAALARSRYPFMSSQQIQELLRVTSRNIDTVGTNKNYKEKLGNGCLDAGKALTDTNTPAIRIMNYGFSSPGNDTISLQLGFKNFLWSSSNLRLSIRSTSSGIVFYDSVASGGSVKMMDSSFTTLGDLKLKVLPYTSDTRFELVRIGIEDSAKKYVDYQYMYLDKGAVPVITSGGAASNKESGISCFPNPFTDYLFIDTDLFETAVMSDVSGNILQKISGRNGLMKVELQNISPGLYFIVSTDTEKTSHFKIIKH